MKFNRLLLLADKGMKLTCLITDKKDLNRQIVRTEFASLQIPELDLELPANMKKSHLSTIEGVLRNTILDLNEGKNIVKPNSLKFMIKFVISSKIEAF